MASVRMRGFLGTTSFLEARKKFFDAANPKVSESEKISIYGALGRVLAEDVIAEDDVPNFDRAAMDGFAVRASDTFGASQTNPIIFEVIGQVQIGSIFDVKIGKNQAASIVTGATLPEGADAVVMLEYTRRLRENEIEIITSITPGENVSKRGEDIKKGEIILRKGAILKPQDIGVIASLNRTLVEVVRKPIVAVMTTGNELVEPGETIQPGKIIDTDRIVLLNMVLEAGGIPLDLGRAQDNLEEIKSKLKIGAEKADIVVITGGTSVGIRDYVHEAIESLGKLIVHGIAMRPAKPTGLGIIGGKPVVSLSGYPVAAMVGFDQFVKPLIEKMSGKCEELKPIIRAQSTRRIASSPGVREFIRVIVFEKDGKLFFEPLKIRGSGILSSMVKANGLVIIPENKEGIEAGEEVEITLFKPIVK
ncbi:MAG: molybdopterin molybdotransferase MoeA [Euryarchaeota archaeon]|nr:molybdopterin molybdotransferase MoeA [Euryarchaeota archaeon]